MLAITIKGLLSHKVRFVLTALSISIGVAFLAGTMVYTATIRRTFDDMLGDTNRHIDALVRSTDNHATMMGDERARLDVALLDVVRSVPGVAAASGNMSGYAQVVAKDGKPLGGFGPPTLGLSWAEDPLLSDVTITEGRPPGPGEVVLDRASVANGRFALGDQVKVLTRDGPQQLTLVGAVRYGNADSPAGATLAYFDVDTARRFVGEAGKVDDISVAGVEGLTRTELRDRIAASLPAGQHLEAITGDQLVDEASETIGSAMSFFNSFMMVFALIAVFVAAFIINNTFSILVAQRTRELALLRALGASRTQIVGSVATEALLLGVLSSFAGLVGGLGLTFGLKALMSAIGFNLPTSGLAIPPSVVGWSLGLGVGVTMLAALVPARRASRVAPMEALQQAAAEPRSAGRTRVAVASALLVGGVGIIAQALVRTPEDAMGSVGLGAVLAFTGCLAGAPAITRPVARLLGWPFARARGEVGHLARENAMRNPRRTSATASALMIGVSLVGTITILAASTRSSTDAVIEQALTADLMVVPGGTVTGMAGTGFSPDVARQIAELPAVEVASPVRASIVTVAGAQTPVAAIDPATFGRVVDLGQTDGDLRELGAGTIAVSKRYADAHRVALGDPLTVDFSTERSEPLRIVAVFERHDIVPDHLLSMATAETYFRNRLDFEVAVRFQRDVDVAATTAAVEQITDRYENIQVMDQTQFREQAQAGVNQLLALVYALLFLSVIIALIGIANTLVLSIHERWHELGLLRALGMTQRQVRASVRYEAVIISLFGTTLGLAAGVALGFAITRALASSGVSRLVLPVGQLTVIGVLASVAGVLAALSPARRAARVQILEAVAAE